MISKEFEYNYISPSQFEILGNHKSFFLSPATEIEEDKFIRSFFHGNVIDSFIGAKCLSTMAKTVASHFSLTLGQIARLRDPVISVGSQQLHFEGFSSCNSVYSRISFKSEAIDGEFIASGCVNIDFNDTTTRAFNSVGKSDKLLIGVGNKEVSFTTGKNNTIEKKVSLPDRWIKGLANVQYYLSGMELYATLDQIQSIRLFQNLPRSPVKSDYFLVSAAGGFQFSPMPKEKSIGIGGIHRLRLVEHLLPFIKKMHLYKDSEDQCFALVLNFGAIQMLFLFSASVFRGFSGEGKSLENLTVELSDEYIIGVNSLFKTNENFNPTLLAIEADIGIQTMENVTATLSSIGLLGFDLESNNHFYRRLPFKLERLKSLNPRLINAKKLIEKENVKILKNGPSRIEAEVKGSGDVFHRVVILNGEPRCTCSWYISHQTKRGLCKHILAVKLMSL